MTRNRLAALSLFVALLTTVGGASTETPVPMSCRDLMEQFRNPPADFRTVPFWVWNDDVSREEIERQLLDFKEKGFGAVFIHPRYGLITEYLSPRWFELVKYSVVRARELGLKIWLYDENSFPSGFAGGHVPAEMPESVNQGQGLVMETVGELESTDMSDVALVLVTTANGYRIVNPAESQSGAEVRVFRKIHYEPSKWYGGFSYVDLLLPGVTEKFIELTMTGYEESIGNDFGRLVPGIFTDEPHIEPPDRKRAIRWTPDLFAEFEKRQGYDLRPLLPLLFEEVGDFRRARHDYYETLLDLFIERWAKPWYSYCETHGISWTGHYWEHEWPKPYQGPDSMAMSAWQQVPGIDMLFNTFDLAGPQFGNIRAVRELASVANQLGRSRTLSETYGAAGWELRFQDMKRLGDWEYALGVNLMNQHLSYMTLKGDRKHDFPQSFSYHEPWWPFYRTLADYYARLSLVLSSGKQVNRILVLEPTTTAWLYAAPGVASTRFEEIDRSFRSVLGELERLHIEYDLGSERIMREFGSASDGRLQVGKREYQVVVLPSGLENLETSTALLIEEFVRAGGKVVALGDPPSFVDGVFSNRMVDLSGRYLERWVLVQSVADEPVRECLSDPVFRLEIDEGPAELVFHQRRLLSDGQVLLVVNSSSNQVAMGRVTLPGSQLVELDSFNGTVLERATSQDGRAVSTRFELQPSGSLLLLCLESPVEGLESRRSRTPIPLPGWSGPTSVERLSENVLTIDYCDLELDGQTERGIYYYKASDNLFRHFGFDGNPWVSSSQYRTNILDRNRFPTGSGFKVTYHFSIGGSVDTGDLRAVVERPELWTVSINGEPVEPVEGDWWLDRSFGVYRIGGYVEPGDNRLELSIDSMNIHCELAPVYLIGDFSLTSKEQGWELGRSRRLHTGDWARQGLPFYAGGVSYVRHFDIHDTFDTGYFIRLPEWQGTVAAVRVNGESVGVIGWPPFELDVSNAIRPGRNRVEVDIFGSLANQLGPHHNVEGNGIVTPWSFKTAPEVQPPGEGYDLKPYGLFGKFELVACRQ